MRPFSLVLCLMLAAVALPALAAPDLDIFPETGRKAVVLTQLACPPCNRMKRELKGKTFPGFSIEWGSAKDPKYKAKAAPTTVKFVAGKEVDRKEGYISAKDLAAWMAK